VVASFERRSEKGEREALGWGLYRPGVLRGWKGSGARGRDGRFPSVGDNAVAFHTGAPSPEARKGKGRSAPGKKRKGMVAADGWGQGAVREGKE